MGTRERGANRRVLTQPASNTRLGGIGVCPLQEEADVARPVFESNGQDEAMGVRSAGAVQDAVVLAFVAVSALAVVPLVLWLASKGVVL